MQPNQQQPYEPWQPGGPAFPPGQVSGPMRRPVEDGTRAQQPLGSTRTGGHVPYRKRQTEPMGPVPRQGNPGPQGFTGPQPGWQATDPGHQPWQGEMPPQPPWQPELPPYQAPPPDPFGEPGEAPELRAVRSDNLYDLDRTFWHRLDDLQLRQQAEGAGKPRARNGGHTIRWMVLIVAVLTVAAFVVYGQVFKARSITVQGNSIVSDEEVLRLAGLSLGVNTLSLNESAIERGIESNHYLSFVCVNVQLPDKLTIRVRERVPAAVIKYCGILYVLDSRGMVLAESLDTDIDHPGLVAVEGFDIRLCEVGRTLSVVSAARMGVYTSVLMELKVMGALDQMRELDLADMDNLYLVSTDGYAVRLGDSQGLHAKLRSMLLTLDKLRQDGYGPGTVDVSAPVNPSYIPENL